MGTHNSLGLALPKGARFILASSAEVYGEGFRTRSVQYVDDLIEGTFA